MMPSIKNIANILKKDLETNPTHWEATAARTTNEGNERAKLFNSGKNITIELEYHFVTVTVSETTPAGGVSQHDVLWYVRSGSDMSRDDATAVREFYDTAATFYKEAMAASQTVQQLTAMAAIANKFI